MKWGAIIVLAALIAATSNNVLADCGWILWFEGETTYAGNSFPSEWSVVEVANTFEKCSELQQNHLAAKLKRLKSIDEEFPSVGKEQDSNIFQGGSSIFAISKGRSTIISYTCWPENRDPRH